MPRRDTFRRLRGKRLTAFGGCVASVSPLSEVPLIPILPHLTCNNNNDNM